MSEANKITILLADDHPVVREGLATIINSQNDMTVIAQASSGEEAIEKATSLKPNMAILDLKMPGAGGLAAIRRIKSAVPDICILVFTTYADETDIIAALDAGANGYLLKGRDPSELLNAIRAASRGEAPIDPAVTKALIKQGGDTRRQDLGSLSEREIEVLQLMSTGKRNKEIADELFITERTVKAHIGNILSKLNVPDRTAAVTLAIKRGLIQI